MDTAAAVDRGDLDELQHVIDQCCEQRDWEALVDVRTRAARAFERGHQLWPIAARAEYRLALEAPAEFAASVVVEGAGRFALGPLPEVAASTHTWSELAPHVVPGPAAVMALHERVVRGENCSAGALPGPPVLELPRRLAAWEPDYPVAEYRADRADFPEPDRPALQPVDLPDPQPVTTDHGSGALAQLAATWVEDSDGRAEAVATDGGALEAIAGLGTRHARIARVGLAEALARMAWTASSGGAHGRRPGAAAGRFGTWWALAALLDRLDDWPPRQDDLGDAAAELEWLVWDAGEPVSGWELRLAVAHVSRGRAWAVTAIDAS